MPSGALLPKQAVFAQEYQIDLNACAAAKRAGYSSRTAEKIGPQLLAKTSVQAAIAAAQAARAQRTRITADEVLVELGRLGFANPARLYDAHGALLPMAQWPAELAPAVASIKSQERFETVHGQHVLVGYLKEVKFHDKPRALALMARHLGLLTDHPPSRTVELSPLLRQVLLEMHDRDQPTPLEARRSPQGVFRVSTPLNGRQEGATRLLEAPEASDASPVTIPPPPRPAEPEDVPESRLRAEERREQTLAAVLAPLGSAFLDALAAAAATEHVDLAELVCDLVELGWDTWHRPTPHDPDAALQGMLAPVEPALLDELRQVAARTGVTLQAYLCRLVTWWGKDLQRRRAQAPAVPAPPQGRSRMS